MKKVVPFCPHRKCLSAWWGWGRSSSLHGRHGMIFLAMLKQYLQKNQQYFLKDKLKDLWERFNNILSVSNLSTYSYFWCLETEEIPWKNQRILFFYCFNTFLNSESVYKHEKWPNPLNTKVSRNMETTNSFEYKCVKKHGNDQFLWVRNVAINVWNNQILWIRK